MTTFLSNKTIIYTKPSCPHCVSAKQLLDSKGIVYEEIVVDGTTVTKAIMNEALGRTDLTTVPQIVLQGKFIPGGASGLRAYYGV